MDFDKKNKIFKTIMLILVTAFITFMITAFGMYKFYNVSGIKEEILQQVLDSKNEESGISKLNKKISVVKKCLEKYYLGEIPEEDELIESAVKGYINGLKDDYTEYLTKQDYDDLMVDVNGNFVGIGIYMTQDRHGNIIILMPIKGSPAEEAELKTGDIIVKVDGEECNGKDASIVSNKIKGEENTEVTLEILRGEETITKTIKRKSVQISIIESEILENNIGYIKLPSFDEGCSEKFDESLTELKQKGIKSLIIDVRDNGGGIVDEVLKISNSILDKDKNIMITVDKNGKEEIIVSDEDSKIKGLKIVLLINENSASASEILAGALQDNQAATLVGTTTYGKGVMQEVIKLSDGSAMKVTIEEFKTPNGNKINKEGIKPDVEVDNQKTDDDSQLKKAIEFLKK